MPTPLHPPSRTVPLILPHLTSSLLLRGLLYWMALRLVVTGGQIAAARGLGVESEMSLMLSPAALLFLFGCVGVLGWVSIKRRRERAFFTLLGMGPGRPLATLLFPAIVAESALLAMAAA